MNNTGEKSTGGLRGIASLFDDKERKELFRKYLYFLGWVEILILLTCWLYQIGDSGRDPAVAAESTFPWRLYFIIAFLAPIAITFLVGVIIVGFNKYFGEAEPAAGSAGEGPGAAHDPGSGRIQQLNRMVTLLQRLPFLALLLLLSVGVAFFYKLDAILTFIGNFGEKSAKIFLVSAGILLVLLSVFALILIILNYRLRKRAMEYQYKSQVADRFGLIILEDNTVLNSQGKLLINGKKWKDSVPLLPETVQDDKPSDDPGPEPVSRPADMKT
ncbi:MAG: hypothetical protein ABFD97_19980 [Syntrophobacter sp.]